MPLKKILKALIFSFITLSTTACSEYWWTRGQPPSAAELLKRAQDRVLEIKETYGNTRPEITSIAEKISSSVNVPSEKELPAALEKLEDILVPLENMLSYGNRPPYQELTGQLRALRNNKNEDVSKDALDLYFARVLFFLSSEMKLPAPTEIAKS